MTNAHDSSWIETLDWVENDTMYMSTTSGDSYKIQGVSRETAVEWCEYAPSVGKFFNDYIRDDNRYSIERVIDTL